MKSRRLTCVAATTLFITMSFSVWMAAQTPTKRFRHYKLIDVGTFGGPASYINGPNNSFPSVNSRGITVGPSATPVPAPANTNPFGCLGRDGGVQYIFHSFALKDGVVTNLGALSPRDQNCSDAQAINEHGEVAGTSENGQIDPVTGLIEDRAVLWKNGKIYDLGTLGGPHSIAFGISNRGQIIGWSLNDVPDAFSILDFFGYQTSNGTQTRAFLWERDHMQDLGTLGGPDAVAQFINQSGQVAGASYTNSTPDPTTGIPTLDPFLWEKGTMIDLGTLGGTSGSPLALNNAGQIIGTSNLAGDQTYDPFLWEKGHLIDLTTSTIGATVITANAINDAGEIVGGAAFTNAPFDAYLRRKGVATDLGVLEGDCSSEAFVINSRDQIGGQSIPCTDSFFRAFLWENGAMVDLNAVVSPGSLYLIDVESMNDRGEIAGLGVPPGCSDYPDDGTCGHAYLLIPVCEDGAEGCADAPLDPALVSQSRTASGARPKTMTAEELAIFKLRMARIAGRNRGFGVRPRR